MLQHNILVPHNFIWSEFFWCACPHLPTFAHIKKCISLCTTVFLKNNRQIRFLRIKSLWYIKFFFTCCTFPLNNHSLFSVVFHLRCFLKAWTNCISFFSLSHPLPWDMPEEINQDFYHTCMLRISIGPFLWSVYISAWLFYLWYYQDASNYHVRTATIFHVN